VFVLVVSGFRRPWRAAARWVPALAGLQPAAWRRTVPDVGTDSP